MVDKCPILSAVKISEYMRRKGNNRRYNSNGRNVFENVTEVWVDNRFIGKGGASIKELQRETGVRVQVTSQGDGNKTLIQVIGSNEATNKSQQLQQHHVLLSPPK
ncbi:hypothetical protein GWI33_014639 [Rhynchophorus ferrugineus]|uniref:K Homology domain-containing protein n=1 Tax=Rhynchophorus ferrugineus TaxID=354439 RepID=A0A834I6R3_RHYFE|nr:hypothetical protein GWI33_014639 [Rhynchophorus ferrugineus]